ncbi:MAG: TlpA family protein disulfide reductase [Actinobacteria bacterium]|nr:TlpA family protein disulfide reductase [Actinomycetota bacterium]
MYFNKIKMADKKNILNFLKNNNLTKNAWNSIKRRRAYFFVISSIMLTLMFLFALTGCCVNLPFKLVYTGTESRTETAAEETKLEETAEEDVIKEDISSSEETGSDESFAEEKGSKNTDKETTVQYENDFTLLGLDKNEVSLHDFKGKLVVLNFWATWCPPCREEIPDFVEVYNMYKDKNVQFIGVADDDTEALVNFISEYNINYPILVDGTVDRVFQKWGIDAIPHTFILNGNGTIVFDQLGMMTKSQLINAIENSLAQLD